MFPFNLSTLPHQESSSAGYRKLTYDANKTKIYLQFLSSNRSSHSINQSHLREGNVIFVYFQTICVSTRLKYKVKQIFFSLFNILLTATDCCASDFIYFTSHSSFRLLQARSFLFQLVYLKKTQFASLKQKGFFKF